MNLLYKNGCLYKPAGWRTRKGYYKILIDGVQHYAHRVIYEMHYGPIPEGMDVDHIDGDKGNNKLDNLRLLNRANNCFNRQGPNRNCKSRVRGVYWHKSTKKYRVQVRGKHIGVFKTLGEAELAANKLFTEI